MLIGCVITYDDDLKMLRDCLATVSASVDKLVVIDGAFADFPHNNSSSCDENLDICCLEADELITRSTPWPTEVDKRNTYLIGNDGDWYLVVDADEEVVGEVIGYCHPGGHSIELRQDHLTPRNVFRLFPHAHNVRYRGAHNALFHGDDLLTVNGLGRQPLPGVHLVHKTSARSTERMERKHEYAAVLMRSELAFRRKWGL